MTLRIIWNTALDGEGYFYGSATSTHLGNVIVNIHALKRPHKIYVDGEQVDEANTMEAAQLKLYRVLEKLEADNKELVG